tara:strand:+ start:231337 stop:231510 length:174 start_codon:yes stop_codon:yes gene_type:complete
MHHIVKELAAKFLQTGCDDLSKRQVNSLHAHQSAIYISAEKKPDGRSLFAWYCTPNA